MELPDAKVVDQSPVVFTIKVHLIGPVGGDENSTMLATSNEIAEDGLTVRQLLVCLDVAEAGARAIRESVCTQWEVHGSDRHADVRTLGLVKSDDGE